MSIFIIRINSVSVGLLKHCRSTVDESHVNQQCNGGRCLASIFLSQLRSFVDFHLYFKSDSGRMCGIDIFFAMIIFMDDCESIFDGSYINQVDISYLR